MYKIMLALSLALTACGHKKEETKPPVEKLPPPSNGGGGSQPMPMPIPPGSGGQGDIVEKQQYMVFHNLKRCWHAVDDIVWDDALAATAKAHAQKCTLTKDTSIAGVYGENLAYGEGLGQIKAQDDWYMQFLYFPYGEKNGTANTQEFSNIVWKGTTKIGCGSALCGSKNYYVCRYSPRGNVEGQYDKNVFMLKPDFATCTGMPRG
jgi:predicted small lipoprotein YifL